MDDKLKGLFPEHKHGEKFKFTDENKGRRIASEVEDLDWKILMASLTLFRRDKDGAYIECMECFKRMIQFHRDIVNLWEELADIKVDKPKNIV